MPLHTPGITAPFHVLSIQGKTGSGKTSLTLSAPGKVAIQSTDHRWDGLIQKEDDWQDKFVVEDYGVRVDLTVDEAFKDASDKDSKEAALRKADQQAARIRRETWLPFVADFEASMKSPVIRTTVWDYADELYDFERLSYFGKLERNPQLAYVPINMEYKQLIAQAHRHQKNLVLIHQMAQKWTSEIDPISEKEKSVKVEGEWRKKGSGAADYYIHSFVETIFVDPKRNAKNEVVAPAEFYIKILQAKLNPAANGQIIKSCPWPILMQVLAPDVPMEAWQ